MKYLLLVLLLASCSQEEQTFDYSRGYDSLYLSGSASVLRSGEATGYSADIKIAMGRATDSTYNTAITVGATHTSDTLVGSGELVMKYLGEAVANDPTSGYTRYTYKGTVRLNDTDYVVNFRSWGENNYDGGLVGGQPELTVNFITEKKN